MYRQLAEEYDLPYRSLGYRQIMEERQQLLKKMGQKPNDKQDFAEKN